MAESVVAPSMTQEQKDHIINAVKKNEGGGYFAGFAQKGDSGLTFGAMQNDVRTNPNATPVFLDILNHYAAENDPNGSISVKNIVAIAGTQGVKRSDFSPEELNFINSALSSDYGKTKTDAMDKITSDALIESIDKAILAAVQKWGNENLGILDPSHPDFLKAAELLGAWSNCSGGLGKFNEYVSGSEMQFGGGTHQLTDAPTLDDVVYYVGNQKYFKNQGEDAFQKWYDRFRMLDDCTEYRVIEGDTLGKLAERFGISLEDLKKLNPHIGENNIIKIGEILKIPNQRDRLFCGTKRIDELVDALRNGFSAAAQTTSPLVLDLDGDGVETLSMASGVYFDHDGNGFAQKSGWVHGDDGLLVLDRNGNGLIDNGSELFGNNTQLSGGANAANGFAALAELDGNGDGVIDANDAAFGDLRVWRDMNGNGQADAGELFTLSELGIASLNVGYTTQNVTDAQGNRHLQAGSYTLTDGTTRAMNDVWFAEDTAFTVALNTVEISEGIAALPEIRGFGNVHSLRQAMEQDTSGVLRAA